MRALVVIDRAEIQLSIVEELRRQGATVNVVSDLGQALPKYATDNPALVVVGWLQSNSEANRFCARLRSEFKDRRTVIVLTTDHLHAKDLERALEAGADDCLVWPIPAELLQLRMHVSLQRAVDRTQRAKSDRQLRDSIERFELAVRGANDGLWDAIVSGDKAWDSSETFVWYSARFKELLGYTDEEFPNVFESWVSRLHPEDEQRTLRSLAAHLMNRVPYDLEYRLLTKSGQYRWFSARGQAVWNERGEVVRVAGSLRDITQAKEYEARLEQSEEKWRSLVQNAPEIVLLTDPDGTIRYINRDLPRAREAVGRSVDEYVDAEYRETTRSAYDALLATGKPQSYEVQSQAVGGGYAWYAARIGPLWQQGRIASVVLVATNITKRKIAEDLLQRERNLLRRLLDLQERERQLVSYEIHDGLVQYLTAGLMHLEAFRGLAEAIAPESLAEYERGVSLLREALAEGRRLISDLRPPILDERGVVAAIEYLVSEFRQDIPQLRFVEHTHCGRLAPTLEVAIFRITQEALSNIRKHSGSKRARIELIQHGEWLRLVVRDWGKGFVPADVREDRFGLQGIRQRARLLGTRALVESSPGHGAAVIVDFPIVADHSTDSRWQPGEEHRFPPSREIESEED